MDKESSKSEDKTVYSGYQLRVKQVVFLHDREITTAITNDFQYPIKLLNKTQIGDKKYLWIKLSVSLRHLTAYNVALIRPIGAMYPNFKHLNDRFRNQTVDTPSLAILQMLLLPFLLRFLACSPMSIVYLWLYYFTFYIDVIWSAPSYNRTVLALQSFVTRFYPR